MNLGFVSDLDDISNAKGLLAPFLGNCSLRTLLFGNIVSKPVPNFLKMYYRMFYRQV